MKGTVYKCTFSDGKVYIGKSRHANLRMQEHFNKTSGPSSPGFYEAYKRLGEPVYEILFEEDFTSQLEREITLCEVERYYIKRNKATDPEYGYNKSNSSNFAPNIKKVLKEKVEELTEELLKERLTVYNCVYNKIWKTKEILTSEELFFVKEKFRKKNAFQRVIDDFNFDDYSQNSDESLEFLLDDGLPFIKNIIEFDTNKEVCRYVYMNADRIIAEANSDKIILKISPLGKVVGEYQSIDLICEELNIVRPDNIRNVLRHKQDTAFGFIWRYKNEYLEKSIDKGVRNDV